MINNIDPDRYPNLTAVLQEHGDIETKIGKTNVTLRLSMSEFIDLRRVLAYSKKLMRILLNHANEEVFPDNMAIALLDSIKVIGTLDDVLMQKGEPDGLDADLARDTVMEAITSTMVSDPDKGARAMKELFDLLGKGVMER